MAHTESYSESTPTDETLATSIDDEIVKSRRMLRERFAVDHLVSVSDDASDKYGIHKQVTLEARIATPTEPTGAIATFYLKTGDYDSEIRFTDERDVDNKIVIVGEVKMILGSTLPDGWLALNGETIGSAASSSDQASADMQDLFYWLWDELTDDESPILDSGGGASSRGADAASVGWAANKRLTMPDSRARMPIGAGTDGVLTDRTIGDTGGDETKDQEHVHGLNSHQHVIGTHDHDVADALDGGGAKYVMGPNTGAAGHNVTTPVHDHVVDGGSGSVDAAVGDTETGLTTTEDVMNPWLAFTMIIKY